MMLLDLNDNSPQLSVPASQDVQVNSPINSPIYSLYAVDPDQESNGTVGIIYSVLGNNNFGISNGNTLTNKLVAVIF